MAHQHETLDNFYNLSKALSTEPGQTEIYALGQLDKPVETYYADDVKRRVEHILEPIVSVDFIPYDSYRQAA